MTVSVSLCKMFRVLYAEGAEEYDLHGATFKGLSKLFSMVNRAQESTRSLKKITQDHHVSTAATGAQLARWHQSVARSFGIVLSVELIRVIETIETKVTVKNHRRVSLILSLISEKLV